jgi:hypothetical protein
MRKPGGRVIWLNGSDAGRVAVSWAVDAAGRSAGRQASSMNSKRKIVEDIIILDFIASHVCIRTR